MVDLDAAWEPWVPVVGQRVTCRPSPECRWLWPDQMPFIEPRWCTHAPEENGLLGTVQEVLEQAPPDSSGSIAHGHRFRVTYDRLVRVSGCPWPIIEHSYSAAEIEPLDALT